MSWCWNDVVMSSSQDAPASVPLIEIEAESNAAASSASQDHVREIVRGEQDNESEIVVAPDELIRQLDQRVLDGLDTIPVTPEAPWDDAGERLVRVWMDAAQTASSEHRATGYKLKFRHKLLSIANIFATVLVFIFTSLFPCTDEPAYRGLNVTAAALALFVASVISHFNYGSKYQQHFEYEGHYAKYAIDCEELLATEPDFRAPKDKTLAELRERKKQLLNAPET